MADEVSLTIHLDEIVGAARKTLTIFIPLGGSEAELRFPQAVLNSFPEKEWATVRDLVRQVAQILMEAKIPP